MTRINDYLLTHTGFQLFHVSYIFGNLEKSIKYCMLRIKTVKRYFKVLFV